MPEPVILMSGETYELGKIQIPETLLGDRASC